MIIRTKKAGTKRTKDIPDVTGAEILAPELAVVASVCMACQKVYRVRVYEAPAMQPVNLSHGYCDNHEPLTGGI